MVDVRWLPILCYFCYQVDNQSNRGFHCVMHLAAQGQTVRRLYRQDYDILRDILLQFLGQLEGFKKSDIVRRRPWGRLDVRTSQYKKGSRQNVARLNAIHDYQKLNLSQMVDEMEARVRGEYHIHLRETPPKLLGHSRAKGVVGQQLIAQT